MSPHVSLFKCPPCPAKPAGRPAMITRELEQLLALQETDSALAEMARREEAARARLAREKDDLEAFREEAAAEKKLLDEALKEHKSLDLDLGKIEEQTRKYSTQMYDVKTNKEYTALKDEIDKNKAEASKMEDRILHLMLREDELKGTAGRRAVELKEKTGALSALEAEVSALLGRMASEREGLLAQRRERAGALAPRLLERYERIRQLRGGSSVARVTEAPGGREAACGECHMTIRPQIIVEIYKGEELIACESCGRILHLDMQPSPAAGAESDRPG